MSITKRQEQILELLRAHSFLTVERLSQMTYTSPSSIRRDLTSLQNLYFVKRTHGGVRLLTELNQAPQLSQRMEQNVLGKKKIAKKAAELLCDGQSILLDGSSTAAFLIPYIAKHHDVVLFTNNMLTAMSAINYGITTHCLGGASVRRSAVLSGEATYKAVKSIHPDILFFSSACLDRDGVISDPTAEENYLRILMLQQAKKRVFLCDSEKFGRQALYTLTTVGEVDACVFDIALEELRANCNRI